MRSAPLLNISTSSRLPELYVDNIIRTQTEKRVSRHCVSLVEAFVQHSTFIHINVCTQSVEKALLAETILFQAVNGFQSVHREYNL